MKCWQHFYEKNNFIISLSLSIVKFVQMFSYKTDGNFQNN